jgi:hypothetical protein
MHIEPSASHVVTMIAQSDWGMGHWTHGEINRLCLNRLDLCNALKLGLLIVLRPGFTSE